MTRLRALIVDDELVSRSMMTGYLQDYFPEVEVVGTADSAVEAAKLIVKTTPDVLFLDVSMPGENGIELLQRFKHPDFEIIFVTAHQEHAVRAFELGALHYLLKPIDIVQLREAIKRAQEVCAAKGNSELDDLSVDSTPIRIALSDGKSNKVIPTAEIRYCQADSSYTHFFLADGSRLTSSYTIGHFEPLLGRGFFRIHKQYLVNLNYVRSYSRGKGGYLEMEGGASLEISVRRKSEFVDRLEAV